MNRYIISALMLLLSVSGAKAQKVLVGDANGDGELTIADVTATTQVLLGKSPQTYLTTQEAFIRNNNLSGSYLVDDVTKTYKYGYEYVDLGLPSGTLWCATNYEGYKSTDKGVMATRWDIDDSSFPACWSLPTEDMFNELKEYCNFEETEVDGVSVVRISNKTDASKYILINRACGHIWSTNWGDEGYLVLAISAEAPIEAVDYEAECAIRPVIAPTTVEMEEDENNGELEARSRK